MKQSFRPGDFVIYRKSKFSTHPGPGAVNVHPAAHGDTYSYVVDKYWIVERVLEDGTVVAMTRRGKKNHVSPDDPMLKRANLLERFFFRDRFSALDAQPAVSGAQ